jgi:hypothetical protein
MPADDRLNAALGFAPHSGWAAVVALGEEVASPSVLVRTRIEMADPSLGGSKQPYHDVEGLEVEEAERKLRRFSESAVAMATESLRARVQELRVSGHAPRVAGILDSAGRKGGSLEGILASHALIHTADGDHFRDALAKACAACDLPVVRVRSKDLLERAGVALRRSPGDLQAVAASLGRAVGPPWGADQKAAALLAWLLLAECAGASPPRRREAPQRR